MVYTIPPSKIKTIFLLVIAVILTIGALVIYHIAKTPMSQLLPPGAECTMEAKLCPDGSYVGRVAPNCDFAECPTR